MIVVLDLFNFPGGVIAILLSSLLHTSRFLVRNILLSLVLPGGIFRTLFFFTVDNIYSPQNISRKACTNDVPLSKAEMLNGFFQEKICRKLYYQFLH